ncbi:MAG: hypothetical protein ACOC9Z_09085 [Chloroflexota bacterium]
MRKALGWLMLAIGVSGIILSIVGVITGRQLIDAIGASIGGNLTTTVDSLDTVRETLVLTRSTVAQLETGLETAEESASNVSTAISESRPLLTESSRIVTGDVPESIETFQESLPALIEVSAAMDNTLRTLSAFRIDRSILGIPLNFDLGVDYDPDVPFDQSVRELGESLDGMPEQLRSLEQYIETTDENLLTMSEDLARLSADLENINSTMDEVEPLINEYITIVTEVADNARESRLLLDRQLAQAKLVVTIIMIWFGLLQVAPIYLGWELVSGRRETRLLNEPEDVSDTPVETKADVVDREDAIEAGSQDA